VSSLFLAEHNVIQYMGMVSSLYISRLPFKSDVETFQAEKCLREEELRVPLYLLNEIIGPLMQSCEQALIVDHADLIREEFIPLLQNGAQEDLARLYRLLARIPTGLDSIRPQFEIYLRNIGLKAVNSSIDDIGTVDPNFYISTLYDVITSSSILLSETFNNDPGLKQAWVKACQEIVNWNKACKPDSKKSAELLATYINRFLHTWSTSNELNEEAFEEVLRHTVGFIWQILEAFY
jgi:cullin 1